ncbi:MAG: protein kinase, partial [Deltaproteobacteria bacterium]|nr:protein kinase [Deltaproteobacteria bacterium]
MTTEPASRCRIYRREDEVSVVQRVQLRYDNPRWPGGIHPLPRTRTTRCYASAVQGCPPLEEAGFHATPDESSIEQWGRELTGRALDGRYRVGKMLGYGSTGGVFAGTHLRLNRAVAIKILHEELRHNPSIRSRFDREAHAASRLAHPNCVEIIDVGEDAQLNYLVMPFVDGVELRELIGTPMREGLAISLIQQVLAALEHAHSVGIIHRDVKPENVLITRDHRGLPLVKLLDFGLAKVTLPSNHKRLTRAGQVFGTPQYMSPEQARGAEVTLRSDLYSTGLLLYELLTG